MFSLRWVRQFYDLLMWHGIFIPSTPFFGSKSLIYSHYYTIKPKTMDQPSFQSSIQTFRLKGVGKWQSYWYHLKVRRPVQPSYGAKASYWQVDNYIVTDVTRPGSWKWLFCVSINNAISDYQLLLMYNYTNKFTNKYEPTEATCPNCSQSYLTC